MILLPAVDIRGGRAVRLYRGNYGEETVYEASPVDAATKWIEAGAEHIHIVDLDGAKEGHLVNLGYLGEIAKLGVPVQFGGGLRTVEAVGEALTAGADRVVVGTAAFENRGFLVDSVERFGDRVQVSIDVRGGLVAKAGWLEDSGERAVDAAMRLQELGVSRFIYTSIVRDGTMEGPDIEEVSALGEVIDGSLIYAGGIGILDDLELLAKSGIDCLEGVIVGKALYEKRFTVKEALSALGGGAAG